VKTQGLDGRPQVLLAKAEETRRAFAPEKMSLQTRLNEVQRALAGVRERLSSTAGEIGEYKAQLRVARTEL
jgi:hypothetical protein